MSQTTDYECDFCNSAINQSPMSGRSGKGMSMDGNGAWTTDPLRGAPKHLCNRCLSSIADLNVCLAGVEGCGGGMKCGSDHK